MCAGIGVVRCGRRVLWKGMRKDEVRWTDVLSKCMREVVVQVRYCLRKMVSYASIYGVYTL